MEAQVQADFQRYTSTAGRYQSALGTFVDQVLGLPWPSGYDKDVVTTVSTARAFRRDVALQEAVLASTPQSSVSSINTRSLIDGGNFVAATRALTGGRFGTGQLKGGLGRSASDRIAPVTVGECVKGRDEGADDLSRGGKASTGPFLGPD